MTATPSPLGRPVGADGEQTRARIIMAAMRCVAEAGYSHATIREIARTADMTSGSLYHYFPNKSELLTAAARHSAIVDEIHDLEVLRDERPWSEEESERYTDLRGERGEARRRHDLAARDLKRLMAGARLW